MLPGACVHKQGLLATVCLVKPDFAHFSMRESW